MKRPKSIFLAVLLYICAMALIGQDGGEFHQVLSVENGLPQNSVLSLDQDELGYLWIGTQSGLSRWNGVDVLQYPRSGVDPFTQGFIRLIIKDYWNRLWIVTQNNKIFQYIAEEDRFLDSGINREIQEGDITQLISDPRRERILLCTNQGGVYQWKPYEELPSHIVTLQDNTIHDFFLHENDLYLGTEKGWFTLRNENTIALGNVFPPPWMGLTNYPIYDLLSTDGTLYAARGEMGLTAYYPGSSRDYRHISDNPVYMLEVDHRGNLICVDRDQTIRTYNVEENIFQNIQRLNFHPMAIKTLQTGQVILGAQARGVWMADPYLLASQNWSSDEGKSDVMSIVEGQDGWIWLGTYNAGIYRWNPRSNEEEYFTVESGHIPSNRIKHLFMDSRSRLWASSYDRGFFLIDQETGYCCEDPEKFAIPREMPFERVNHITEDKLQRLWLSTESGLYIFAPSSQELISLSDELNSTQLGQFSWASLRDSSGNIWVGQEHQLLQLDSNAQIKAAIGIEQCWFLMENSHGLIFAASPGGLMVLSHEGLSIPLPVLEETLSGLSVYAVQEDQVGNHWITTNKGVFWWNQQQGHIRQYTDKDGLLSQEFNLYSVEAFSEGSIALGNIKGVHIIDPSEVIYYPHGPRIYLDEIRIDNLSLADHYQVDDRHSRVLHPSYLTELVIHPNEKFLTLGFSSMDFHYRENTIQEYRLLGFNNQWIDVSEEHKVNLVNLPPGEYQFQLRAQNQSSLYSDIRTLDISVLPPFHQTLWFQFMMVVIIIVITTLIILYIKKLNLEIDRRTLAEKQYSQLNNNLEDEVLKRTDELTQAMDQLKRTQQQIIEQEKMSSLGQVVAGVAHEINTPLGVAVLSNSIIVDRIKSLKRAFTHEYLTKEDLADSIEDLEKASERMGFNLDRAASLVTNFKQVAVEKNLRELMDFDLCSTIQSLINSLYNEFKRKQIQVVPHLPPSMLIKSYPGDISQVLTNIIMNSLEHGFDQKDSKQSLISLFLEKEDGLVLLRVRDNGRGMTEEVKKKIFEPFYTTNRHGGGTGLGLNIVYIIVREKLKGTIEVESSPGQGCEFLIKLPKELPDEIIPSETEPQK